MNPIIIKIILLTSLALIFYQDLIERAVWWFLFPVFLMTGGYLYFEQSLGSLYWINISFNLLIIAFIISLSFLYAKLKMKVIFFKEAFGPGDLLFFLGFSVAFPTISFSVLFVFSLIFSLGLHIIFSRKKKQETIPLAGFASLFLIFIYLSNWFGMFHNLYMP